MVKVRGYTGGPDHFRHSIAPLRPRRPREAYLRLRTLPGEQSHVVDAVSDRLSNPLTGAQVTVGGQSVDLAQTEDGAAFAQALTGLARVLGASEAPASEDDGWPGTGLGVRESPTLDSAAARAMSGRELLLGSAFHLAREGDGAGPGLAAWGRVTMGVFDGEAPADDGNVRIDDDVTTGLLGADAEWDRLLAGVAVSLSEGEGTFAQPGVDSGTLESTMTTVSPYARMRLSERVSAWGLFGLGTGDMTIVQAANERGQPERITRTDIAMHLGAVGAGGRSCGRAKSAGWTSRSRPMRSSWRPSRRRSRTKGAPRRMRAGCASSSRGSRSFATGGGGVLTPGLELGLRHDGGDAETGTGVELGGCLVYADPASGLSVGDRRVAPRRARRAPNLARARRALS